jgi:putative transposase
VKDKTKAALARALSVSRSTLYYVSKKERSDWELKIRIEGILRTRGCASYGSRRLAQALNLNRKQIRRVMRKYGIKPYRRRGRKWRKTKNIKVCYPNLLLTVIPAYPGHIWASDFTELSWRGLTVYVCTVLDLYSREIVGVSVSLRKGAQLTLQALWNALLTHQRPHIFHSDNGTDYDAAAFRSVLIQAGTQISRSAPGCPWENGYQESWYDKFKVDLGDPNRFNSLGELVAEIYRTIWDYNNLRIHSALKMPPRLFTENFNRASMRTYQIGV